MEKHIADARISGMEVTPELMKRFLREDLQRVMGMLYSILESEAVLDCMSKTFYETHLALKMNGALDELKKQQAARGRSGGEDVPSNVEENVG